MAEKHEAKSFINERTFAKLSSLIAPKPESNRFLQPLWLTCYHYTMVAMVEHMGFEPI